MTSPGRRTPQRRCLTNWDRQKERLSGAIITQVEHGQFLTKLIFLMAGEDNGTTRSTMGLKLCFKKPSPLSINGRKRFIQKPKWTFIKPKAGETHSPLLPGGQTCYRHLIETS